MAGYNEIRGLRVKYLSADPSNAENGQVWYNSTSGSLRAQGMGVSAWSSGSPLMTARHGLGGAGTPTAALAFGGAAPSASVLTEEYNGSGWSAGGSMSTARYSLGRAGTQTAALAAGGQNAAGNEVTTTEEYGGASWTSGTALPTVSGQNAGFGTQTAAVSAGGNPSGTSVNKTFEYDGSNWTTGGDLVTPVRYVSGSGTLTSGIVALGYSDSIPGSYGSNQNYDGTNWTTGHALNTNRFNGAMSGPSNSDALAFGGSPYKTNVEQYDGSSWSEIADLSAGKASMAATLATPTNGALVFGGVLPALAATTEKFNSSTNIITAAAWAAGGSINSARRGSCAGGIQTAAYYAGGIETAASAKTETYDGSSWSEVNAMGTARYGIDTNIGTLTAGLTAGGKGGGTVYGNTEEWDGTNWSEQTDLSTSRRYLGGFGIQTAGVVCGGRTAPGPQTNATEEYNGSSWTTGGNMGTTREYAAACGIETAGLTMAGNPTPITNVEHYNGTAWSEQSAATPSQLTSFGISGTQTNALIFGGETPSATAASFNYDGTTFATSPSLGTARSSMGSPGPSGTSTSAICIAGYTSTNVANTEEFTPETTAANIKDFTTS